MKGSPMVNKALYILLFFASTMATSARADTLNFVLAGEGSTYAFQLPSVLTPSGSDKDVFTKANVIITLNSQDKLAAEIAFFTQDAGGGMEFVRDTPQFTGPQIFTLDQPTITFHPGTYNLTNSQDDAPYTLSISQDSLTEPSPVPEPPSGFMLTAGTVFMMFMMRRRIGTIWIGTDKSAYRHLFGTYLAKNGVLRNTVSFPKNRLSRPVRKSFLRITPVVY